MGWSATRGRWQGPTWPAAADLERTRFVSRSPNITNRRRTAKCHMAARGSSGAKGHGSQPRASRPGSQHPRRQRNPGDSRFLMTTKPAADGDRPRSRAAAMACCRNVPEAEKGGARTPRRAASGSTNREDTASGSSCEARTECSPYRQRVWATRLRVALPERCGLGECPNSRGRSGPATGASRPKWPSSRSRGTRLDRPP